MARRGCRRVVPSVGGVPADKVSISNLPARVNSMSYDLMLFFRYRVVNAGGRWCKNLDAGERSECMANKHGTARDEPPPGRACSITAKPRHLHAKQRG